MRLLIAMGQIFSIVAYSAQKGKSTALRFAYDFPAFVIRWLDAGPMAIHSVVHWRKREKRV